MAASQTIAIVTAFAASTVAKDLRIFDKAHALPDRLGDGRFALGIAKPQGSPSPNPQWTRETSLDVQWAHAMAPGARILLVQARNDAPQNLVKAVNYARRQRGVTVISMSWGYPTPPANAAAFNAAFTTPPRHIGGLSRGDGITFVTAAGDHGYASAWPDALTPLISVGGSFLTVDPMGNYAGEAAFQQSGLPATVAYAAAGGAGGFVTYDSVPLNQAKGWQTVEGTSAGSPQWAALFAIVDEGRALLGKHSLDGPGQSLPALASLSAIDFHPVVGGGPATGRGSPVADQLVQDLVAL